MSDMHNCKNCICSSCDSFHGCMDIGDGHCTNEYAFTCDGFSECPLENELEGGETMTIEQMKEDVWSGWGEPWVRIAREFLPGGNIDFLKKGVKDRLFYSLDKIIEQAKKEERDGI